MDIFYESFGNIASAIQTPPGFIIGPISTFFGFIIDFIYRAIATVFTPINALGFSIVIMTLMVRVPLIPSQVKMLQNSKKTQLAKPELDKIRAKYGNTRDPELRRKMAAEQQAVNQKHGINLLASCLPMLIIMPVFVALFSVFGRAFMFIPSIGESYSAVSYALMDLGPDWFRETGNAIIWPYLPTGNTSGQFINQFGQVSAMFYPGNVENMNRAIHVFTETDWQTIFYSLQGEQLYAVQSAHEAMLARQSFFGLNLVSRSGLQWPGIIIPILTVGTMVYSTWQTQRLNPPTDPQSKMMQRIMLIVMPVMFAFFVVNAPSGVGLYWTAGNIFVVVQNIIVFKYFRHKIDPTIKKEPKDERR